MIDVDELPEDIQHTLMLKWDCDHLEMTSMLQNLSPAEVFEAWCEYEGLIHYSRKISNALDSIRRAASHKSVNDSFDKSLDITGAEEVEICIGHSGKTIWVNTLYGVKLRICRIIRLVIQDDRPAKTTI
jgi:hypothetical protein